MNQDILLTILGGGNLILFLQFLIQRYDKKKEEAEEKEGLKDKLTKLEKDGLRTQLLLLLLMMPDEKKEILTLAEHYFKVLHGNWYMTSLFDKWCEKTGEKPAWFKGRAENAQD